MHGPRDDDGTLLVLAALAAIAAVLFVLWLRPARSAAVPARVLPGDGVATGDGLAGVVERLDGAFALVRVGPDHAVWAEASSLMRGSAGGPDVAGSQEPDAIAGPEGEHAGEGPGVAHLPSPTRHTTPHGALARFADAVFVSRRMVVIGWTAAIVACMPLAATAEKSFSAGGFLPDGEARQVQDEVRDTFRMPLTSETVIVPGTVQEVGKDLTKALPDLYAVDHVLFVGPPRASSDGTLVAFDISFDATDDAAQNSYEPINDVLASHGFPRSKLQVAGTPAVFHDIGVTTKEDLAKAESIGLPAALVVLLLVFGTAVAATLPLLVGVAAVIVTLALLHVLSLPLDLSIYVMNIASMLGLGIGIDYSLLSVSRFREELAAGRSVREATITTVTSSGRAAAISGVAVLVGLAGLALIPLSVLHSIAIAGVVVVAVTVFASLTLMPAALAMLGHRIERWPVPGRGRRTVAAGADHATGGGWHRIAHAVMRHPALAIAVAAIALLALASPARTISLDVPHDEVLPASAPARTAREVLKDRFGERVTAPTLVVLDSAQKADIDATLAMLRGIENVAEARLVKSAPDPGKSLLALTTKNDAQGGPQARAVVERIRELKLPAPYIVGGQAEGEIEFLQTIRDGAPRTIAAVFLSTIIILAIAFRSLTLPLKAIALDTLSILGSLGLVIAVFQHGKGAHLLGTEPLGYTEATIPIILFCVLFGLSMDYEVFMLAKVTERYQAGDDNREATAQGVATTAPLVTGAALILIVIGISFALTELVLVKQIGFGMAVALALDATLVRILLLPATMRYLGDANWWLPEPLLRRIPRFSWAH